LSQEVSEVAQKKKGKPIAILVGSILLIMILVYIFAKDMDRVKTFISGSGYIGLIISIGLYGLLGATVIPSEPLTVLISTIYGPIQATLVAGLGNMVAALLEYYLGAKIGDVTSFMEKKEKLPLGLGKLPIDSPIFLMAGRMMPGYGPKFVSVVSGVYKVPILLYLWTSAIPTFLGAALFAFGGFGLSSWIKNIHP
jgi:uncharacterized membrane protein YdjX (TVP38/TMEM64 family)